MPVNWKTLCQLTEKHYVTNIHKRMDNIYKWVHRNILRASIRMKNNGEAVWSINSRNLFHQQLTWQNIINRKIEVNTDSLDKSISIGLIIAFSTEINNCFIQTREDIQKYSKVASIPFFGIFTAIWTSSNWTRPSVWIQLISKFKTILYINGHYQTNAGNHNAHHFKSSITLNFSQNDSCTVVA